jgi:hypothetical protein
MGEVFGSDIRFVRCHLRQRNDQRDCFSSLASSYQQVMDSVLNYPLYDAIVQGFTIPGPGNLSNVSDVMGQIQNSFKVALFIWRCQLLSRRKRILLFSETFWKTTMSPDGIANLWTLKASCTSPYSSGKMFFASEV